MRLGGDFCTVHLLQVPLNFSHGHASGVQRDDFVVEARPVCLVFGVWRRVGVRTCPGGHGESPTVARQSSALIALNHREVNPEQPAISPILLRTTQINFINVPGIRKTTYFNLAISDITKHHKNCHLLQLNTEFKHAKVIITVRNLASC